MELRPTRRTPLAPRPATVWWATGATYCWLGPPNAEWTIQFSRCEAAGGRPDETPNFPCRSTNCERCLRRSSSSISPPTPKWLFLIHRRQIAGLLASAFVAEALPTKQRSRSILQCNHLRPQLSHRSKQSLPVREATKKSSEMCV